MIDLKKIRQYVVEEVENFDERMSLALARMDKYRESLERADYEEIDSKIYDGCREDEDDEYVIKHSYRFFIEEEKNATYVDFYYGNITFEIGYININ